MLIRTDEMHNIIHVTGWTRGGTTFTKRCFLSFEDVWLSPVEPDYTYKIPHEIMQKNVVIKSPAGGTHSEVWRARGAKVIYVIRDPRDKIASDWDPADENMYSDERGQRIKMPSGQEIFAPHQWDLYDWIKDFDALSHNSLIMRYEDLCREPDKNQKILASYFDLIIKVPLSQLQEVSTSESWDWENDEECVNPLRGKSNRDPFRPPDTSSIGQWKGHACEAYAQEFVRMPVIKPFMERFYQDE